MNLTLTIMGWYYVITGVWPLIHMKSFEAVSGTKTDKWLVRTVSLLILSSGIIFVNFNDSESSRWLAIMNAVSLIFIDVRYSLREVVRKIYLADAVVEVIFLILIVMK